jgi:hypothetical protein
MHPSLTLPALLFMTACTLWPVKTGANTPVDQVVPPNAPRSEFKDDIGFGKDPFFPKSTRRPKVVVKPVGVEPPRPSVPGNVVLKGISFTSGRKLAIVNDRTLAEGEEFTLKVNGQPVKIKCVEIKEKSVIVSVGSATKELDLPTL